MKLARIGRSLLASFALLVSGGCQSDAQAVDGAKASFGVLFGGQLQERQTLPLIVDQARQTQLLRVEFSAPTTAPTDISWEIDRPKAGSGAAAAARIVETGKVTLPVGRSSFDQTIPFRPGDPLGRWFIRARVAERVVLNRGFDVVAPESGAVPAEGRR